MSDTSIMIQAPHGYARSLSDWSPFVQLIQGGPASQSAYTFELRAAHIALLQAASWEWDDNFSPGAPLVDAKRPFGNSGRYQIPKDIYKIVDEEDPDTLLAMEISEEFEDSESNPNADSDNQALSGLWAECALVISLMLECAKRGELCAPGSKWKITSDDNWRRLPARIPNPDVT